MRIVISKYKVKHYRIQQNTITNSHSFAILKQKKKKTKIKKKKSKNKKIFLKKKFLFTRDLKISLFLPKCIYLAR